MPPKVTPKAKKETSTPDKKDAAAPSTTTPAKVKSAKATKRKSPATPKSGPAVFSTLVKDHAHGNIPIDVTYKDASPHSRFHKGRHVHYLELSALSPFTLMKTVTFTEGEHKGLQAIILQPSKPFRFLDLPIEAQGRIYTYYFAPGGIVNAEIPLEAKRKQSKDLWAKSYSNNSPYRVALLSVNKGIHATAIQIFYAHTLRLENTTTLLDFLGQISNTVRARLISIAIQSYVKTTSRNAMHFLAECGNIRHLHIVSGVWSECDPIKASRSFFADAQKFMETIAATKESKSAGVDVITFGKQALIAKDEQKRARPWGEEDLAEFWDLLRRKMEK